jgi:hypothetical protein
METNEVTETHMSETRLVDGNLGAPEAVNVLIDTCSLILLLSASKSEYLIDNLEFWINNKRIRLFTNEVVVREWNEKKEQQREQFHHNQRTKYNHTREVLKIENLRVSKELQPSTELFDKQITRIDSLLAGAVLLTISKDVKAKSAERIIPPRKAPFHNNALSTKDAFIIFSALEYFYQQSIPFIFISDNKNDFAAFDDSDRNIHPELIEDYPGVQIEYYRNIGHAISDLRKQIDIALIRDEQSVTTESNNSSVDLPVDRTKPMLDQLAEYLTMIHEDVVYVPAKIVVSHYPFRIGNQHSASYGLFTAETSNEKLISFFAQLGFDQNGALPDDLQSIFPDVVDATEKCRKVLKHLTTDLIFSISNRRGGAEIPMRYTTGRTCSCPVCEFKRFNFINSLNQLDDEPNSIEEHFTIAYANYQFGNYLTAVKLFRNVLAITQGNNQNTSSFIAEFNLSKLGIFLYNNYFKNKEVEIEANELMGISHVSLIETYARPHNRELLEYIAEGNFLTKTRDRVHDLSYKILDSYYQSLTGGFNSNNYVWSLKNQLAEIDSLLTFNRLIYDRFSDYSNLMDRIFEAMFASHAIKASAGSRLHGFDDWTLQRMMLYGNAEKLNKHYGRYKLKKLTYEIDETDDDGTFIEILNNFFNSYPGLDDRVLKHCEDKNEAFWDYYNRLFSNALTLISIVEIPTGTITGLVRKIVNFISVEARIDDENRKYVRILINRVGQDFPGDLLDDLLWVLIGNKKYLGSYCVEVLCELYVNKKRSISPTDEQFALLKERYIEIADGGITKVHPTIVQLCRIINDKGYVDQLKGALNDYLGKHFNFSLYYQAVIFDAIPYNDDDFPKFINSVLPSQGRKEIKGYIFGRASDRYDGVNDPINLAFKVGLDTTAERFRPIRELSPYYDWLLDMDSFDYDNFDPYWVTEYKTRFYFGQIAKHDKVRQALEGRLKDEVTPELEKQYYSIYVRKPWDKQD